MRHRWYAIFCLGLITHAAQARELRIAAWNMEHLAAEDGAGCNPRSEEHYAALRNIVSSFDPDIIAFQEVENAAAARRVFDSKLYKIETSRQRLRAGYDCRRDDPATNKSTRQLTGFAIKKGIPYKRNDDFKALDVSTNSSLRWGTDITLLGKRPIRLLNVHLKASCPSQDLDGKKSDCITLAKQQPLLEELWMEQRHRDGIAFAVLGDFNRHLLTPGDKFWERTDDEEPASLKLTAMRAAQEVICRAKYPKRIDQIVADSKALSMLKPETFQVIAIPNEPGLSDHCPITVVLEQ